MEPLLLVGPTVDNVVTLTLNRPEKRNALSIALRDEISDALDAVASDEDVKAVIVTGAGDVFCAGFDLGEFQRMDDPDIGDRLWPSSDRYHRTCIEFPLPLIAAVNGPALAGGFDLAVMCDIRVAAPEASFAHPEISFGDVVYGPLHDLVGGAIARELCFTGRQDRCIRGSGDAPRRLGRPARSAGVRGHTLRVHGHPGTPRRARAHEGQDPPSRQRHAGRDARSVTSADMP